MTRYFRFILYLVGFLTVSSLVYLPIHEDFASASCTDEECASERALVESLDKKIHADLQAINSLGFERRDEDIREWLKLGLEARKKAIDQVQEAALFVFFLNAKKVVTAGGSLHIPNSKKAIEWLRDHKVNIKQLEEAISGFARIKGKPTKAKEINEKIEGFSKLVDIYILKREISWEAVGDFVRMVLSWGVKTPPGILILSGIDSLASLVYSSQGVFVQGNLDRLAQLNEQELTILRQRIDSLHNDIPHLIEAKAALEDCLPHEIILDNGSYHIGDGDFKDTTDLGIVGSNALIGGWYTLNFTLEHPASLKLTVHSIYGVDQGASVRIDGLGIGAFSPANNHGSFVSSSIDLKAGQHRVSIASFLHTTGDPPKLDADDLVFQGVGIQGKIKKSGLTTPGKGFVSQEQTLSHQDNFSDPRTGMPQWKKDFGETAYADNEYRITANEPDKIIAIPVNHTFDNFDLTVMVHKADGAEENAFGVAFGIEESSLERFLISSTGSVRSDMPGSTSKGFHPSTIVKQGAETNELRLISYGSEMAFFINGQMVIKQKDNMHTLGYAWLLGGTSKGEKAKIGFRDLKIIPLKERPSLLSGVPSFFRSKSNAKDVSELVYVPAGKFLMGNNDAPLSRPAQEVQTDGYWISRYEVTNEQFAKFVSDSSYAAQGDWRKYASPKKEKHPVVGVTWNDAVEYARWAGGRLPTEAEWEKAARGTDSRAWAWGTDADAKKSNLAEQIGSSGTVGSIADDLSPYGCFDMTGNVREWTASLFMPYSTGEYNREGIGSGERVVRGGCWHNSLNSARLFNRDRGKPNVGDETRGFRIVLPE